MGHGYGLDHSRRDGADADYQEPWDIMSTLAAYSAPDPDYANRGPGLNAWNMRGRGWLDETPGRGYAILCNSIVRVRENPVADGLERDE